MLVEDANRIETGVCEAFNASAGNTLLRPHRQPLVGGHYTKEEALTVLNSHFFVGKNNDETGIFRIKDDGLATFTPSDQFKLDVANIFVRTQAVN